MLDTPATLNRSEVALGQLTIVDRIAAAMIDHVGDSAGCTRQTLLDEGFSGEELSDENVNAARTIANARFMRYIERAVAKPTREDYVALGAEALAGVMPTRKVILATLSAAGIPANVADDVFADVCIIAGRQFGQPVRSH